MVHHLTFSINSICHFFGRRRFPTDDRSTNVFWLALPTMGESWHHNHHAFPRSAMHGLRWWEVDIGGLVIRAMKRVGLAWNVVLISPERQEQRKLQAAPEAAPDGARAAAARGEDQRLERAQERGAEQHRRRPGSARSVGAPVGVGRADADHDARPSRRASAPCVEPGSRSGGGWRTMKGRSSLSARPSSSSCMVPSQAAGCASRQPDEK